MYERDRGKERNALNTKPKENTCIFQYIEQRIFLLRKLWHTGFSFSLAILNLANFECDKCCNNTFKIRKRQNPKMTIGK
jgi:hypothetical protein